MDEKPPGGNEAGWKYNTSDAAGPAALPKEATEAAQPPEDNAGSLTWTASEFIEHKKPAGWYLLLAAITVAIAATIYYLSRDYISTGAIVAIGIIFGVIAGRKPRSLEYKLDTRGLTVAGKLYPYRHFKAFWVAHEGALSSANLLPLKRFMPVLAVYFDPAEEAKITELLGNYLPVGSHKADPIDNFLRKIRF